ncbi:MAG: tetratricopeptide repeat protein [Bacteroidetes bacterium]|jgi:tetratricopeptide (TPR) repeat protein|nr:tetratricopeptide repeat protein [Bacteroidota bacterium]
MESQREVAIDLLKQQRFSEALSIFESLIDASPNDWNLYFLAGHCCRAIDNLPQAVRFLENASILNQNEACIFLGLGIAEQLLGNFDKAIDSLEKAIGLDSTLMEPYNSLGITYRKIGNHRRAIECYKKALDARLKEVNKEVHRDKDCVEEHIEDGEKVLAILPPFLRKTKSLLKSDPSFAITLCNLGACFLALEEFEIARKHFMESIDFIPIGYNYTDPYRYLEEMDL